MPYKILRALFRWCLLILLVSHLCHGQNSPASKLTPPIIRENGKGYDLSEWLEHNVPAPIKGECKPTFDFFYFKINGLGKIDTLFHDGTLRETVTQRIIKNTYSTEGHWKIPPGMKPKDSRMFVFPYFDFGGAFYGDKSCPDEHKLFQKTSQVARLSFVTVGAATVILRPAQNGGGYIKM